MLDHGFRRCIVLSLLAGALLSPATAFAACNTAGCWNKEVEAVRVDQNGRIWLVTTNPQELATLAPADGCTVRQIWLNNAVSALYVRPDDPDRDEKYALILSAFSTGTPLRFVPIRDAATGWCSIHELTLG